MCCDEGVCCSMTLPIVCYRNGLQCAIGCSDFGQTCADGSCYDPGCDPSKGFTYTYNKAANLYGCYQESTGIACHYATNHLYVKCTLDGKFCGSHCSYNGICELPSLEECAPIDEETGKNRQRIIQNIAKEGIELGYLIPYNDTSNKDMLELYIDEEFWVAGQYIKRTKLEITEYNNEPAIKVYISDYKDVYYHIGYVPKVEINKVLEILNNNPKEIYSEFTGGKFKEIYFDDEVLKDKVRINDSLSYGVKVTIKY